MASVVIHAPPPGIFRALRAVTPAEMPLAHALGTIRYLPGLLSGRMQRRTDELTRPFVEALAWPTLAEQPDREVVVGTIGRLHDLLDQQFVQLASPEAFERFDTPDYEKQAESFCIAGGSDAAGYVLLAEHRTQPIGPSARWKFAWYWYRLVGWSGNWLLRMLLEAVRRRAEGEGASAQKDRPRRTLHRSRLNCSDVCSTSRHAYSSTERAVPCHAHGANAYRGQGWM
jgi:hypothetical protein